MSAITPIPETIRKEVRVEATPETAFRVFTEQMSEWWPLATHGVFGAESTEAILELTPGARWFERTPDGRESVWGTVVAVERPKRRRSATRSPPEPTRGLRHPREIVGR